MNGAISQFDVRSACSEQRRGRMHLATTAALPDRPPHPAAPERTDFVFRQQPRPSAGIDVMTTHAAPWVCSSARMSCACEAEAVGGGLAWLPAALRLSAIACW